jgi:putative endonuclease
MDRIARGRVAERSAEAFLVAQGLVLRARNFRRRFGEIDLIMRDGESLVFIEVRMRESRSLVSAAESIDFRKRRKLLLTAEAYLQASGWDGPSRFDVVLVDHEHAIEWITDAFDHDH